jgi:hypothetical protein
MTVSELIAELQKWPSNAHVHIDVCSDENQNWEGNRVVRSVAGVRHQDGYNAIAIDGAPYSYDQEGVVFEESDKVLKRNI